MSHDRRHSAATRNCAVVDRTAIEPALAISKRRAWSPPCQSRAVFLIASASLFSPMPGFGEMAFARAYAEPAGAALMSPVSHPASHWPNPPRSSWIDRRHFLRSELAVRRT